ncbi:hypothetical protein HHK36_020090 [Tetracentron sinense]|uniref:Lipoxygenase n=1 Tax=Tetracentron sinense TaxID=13715 RepID=A0A834YYD6_TETSI|nr:hypothetical protein HHK36_020090 [Tetracentron sinense]
MEHGCCTSLPEYLNSSHPKIIDRLSPCTNHATQLPVIKGRIVVRRTLGRSGPGKAASVQLYSTTVIDPNTGKGKLTEKADLKHGKNTEHGGTLTITYKIKFHVEPEFGIPGAFIINNRHKYEFFLNYGTLDTFENQIVHFECNSWVYPFSKTKADRLFFSNTSYLPNHTPEALRELRNEELIRLRGDGRGERKEWDRIYDYDYYNDLGNTDKDLQHKRPVLGGSRKHPYPRRGRTGRPPSNLDPLTESRPDNLNLDIYVPPDEKFSPQKMSEFIGNSIRAIVHFLIREANLLFQHDSGSFESFEEIYDMFSSKRSQKLEGWVEKKLKNVVSEELVKEFNRARKENYVKFPLPQIITVDEFGWKDDAEFGREMLAGINPTLIQCLRNFPMKSRYGMKSSIKPSHIEHNLDGMTLDEAMAQWRILILDHHDYLMPFLKRINREGVCVYASRTLLFLRNDATLKPLVIELSLPDKINRVFLPATQGYDAALWHLAKAHVAANDSGYHQLISHWLKTHAVIEPFIIATRRQLSVMHPVHRLLDPHFKDTMHVNAISRSILINAGGILEKTMFTGKLSMELSSELYKDWNFDEQGLPADLFKRGLAMRDSSEPSGVRLLFEDYPYGADGLEIWVTIKAWVTDFCSIFYSNDIDVSSDPEIQAWWSEIRNVGHGDKRNENWWYEMKSLSDLIEALTTLIWIASAFHASVNFGQYGYAGYPPNRPSLCRKFVPEEGTLEFAEFLKDPDKYYLKMLPERFEMNLGVSLIEVLSRHTSEEVYLGQRQSSEWTDNEEVRRSFDEFEMNLQQVEKIIVERNGNPELKNRKGPACIPYTLLYPDTSRVSSKGGITGKGIPNSVSI